MEILMVHNINSNINGNGNEAIDYEAIVANIENKSSNKPHINGHGHGHNNDNNK